MDAQGLLQPVAQELLQPLLVALVSVATAAISAGVPLLLVWVQRHLAIANTAAGAAILAAANNTVQQAAQNAAGSVLHSIQSGDLDLGDRASVGRALLAAAKAVEGKVPDALATVRARPGVLADMVMSKFALQQNAGGQVAKVDRPAALSSGSG